MVFATPAQQQGTAIGASLTALRDFGVQAAVLQERERAMEKRRAQLAELAALVQRAEGDVAERQRIVLHEVGQLRGARAVLEKEQADRKGLHERYASMERETAQLQEAANELRNSMTEMGSRIDHLKAEEAEVLPGVRRAATRLQRQVVEAHAALSEAARRFGAIEAAAIARHEASSQPDGLLSQLRLATIAPAPAPAARVPMRVNPAGNTMPRRSLGQRDADASDMTLVATAAALQAEAAEADGRGSDSGGFTSATMAPRRNNGGGHNGDGAGLAAADLHSHLYMGGASMLMTGPNGAAPFSSIFLGGGDSVVLGE
jgi:hypothetical protein